MNAFSRLAIFGLLPLTVTACGGLESLTSFDDLEEGGGDETGGVYAWLLVWIGAFGFFGGAFVAMFGVLLAEFFGVHRVVSAMDMTM